MKDLYRRNKLRPRETDRNKIHNSAGSEDDKEAAFTILLNPDRKTHYDRVHNVLSQIGYVRRHLGLAGKSEWRSKHEDFLNPQDIDITRARARKKRRFLRAPRLRFPSLPWAALLTWSVVIAVIGALVPLTWIALKQDPLAARAHTEGPRGGVIMYTLSPQVPVYDGPDRSAPQIAELPEFFEVSMDPRQSDSDWARVWLAERSGWVPRSDLAEGSAEAAQLETCRQHGLWRPPTGQHLVSGNTGPHRLVVHNSSARDALVKLKNHEGRTQVFFYVRGGETARIESIPEGRYQIHYAQGAEFSPACGRFLAHMQAVQEARFVTFSSRSGEGAGGPAVVTRTVRPDGGELKSIPNQSF